MLLPPLCCGAGEAVAQGGPAQAYQEFVGRNPSSRQLANAAVACLPGATRWRALAVGIPHAGVQGALLLKARHEAGSGVGGNSYLLECVTSSKWLYLGSKVGQTTE